MPNQQNQNSRFAVTAVMITALVTAGCSYAFYQRLTDQMEENQHSYSRLEQSLQKLANDNNEKFISLSRMNNRQPITKDIVLDLNPKPKSNETQIIKQINDQNRLIGKLLDHFNSMQEQISKLERRSNVNSNLSQVAESGANGAYTQSAVAKIPVTIEDMDQETQLADNYKNEVISKAESTFMTQKNETGRGAEMNMQMQTAFEKVRNDMQYNDLNINNIDCKDTMCRVDMVHSDLNHLEMFDLSMLLAITDDQPMTSTTNTKQLADGKISTTYYLSSE